MTTHYYYHESGQYTCSHCNQVMPRLYIGHHDPGFVLALRSHPEIGIKTLADWQDRWKSGKIFNQDGEEISSDDITVLILKRSTHPGKQKGDFGEGPPDYNFFS